MSIYSVSDSRALIDSPRITPWEAIAAELMELRRGGKRLALGLLGLWFVFWTFAYVLQPYSTLRVEPSYASRVTAWNVVVPCVIAAVVLGSWVVLGFRPAPEDGRAPTTAKRARLRVRLSSVFASQTPVGRPKP